MNRELYEKVTKVYKALVSRWSHSEYFDGYVHHQRARWENNKDIWDFINQFQNVPFHIYFRSNHIGQFSAPAKYFDTDTIIISEKEILFHYDFSLVLYSYCAYQLRNELKKFREMLDKEFEDKFSKFVKKDEYSFRYRTGDHENIYNYFLNQLPNYALICNLLSIGGILTIEDYYVKIRYIRIDSIIKGLEEQYNFDEIEIK
ncbi:hypothetical protein [Flavobacterium hibernum]|uniref:Uncharacterized protein n=1 Tax=Flavobacterium hibernum TaxID=37752 RepID=A0A0D0EFM4_9FLAO|nr:hypothetical protein [Flavobacterium hibernum]KIO54359.1 hypothetical protein IW18_02570 [Flavobacterium hibernum]OXA88176.1 hypothetical protein B0A73_10425 [Flavobacterium hibernum]STO10801.1 Uncharacterised protein [Flavobacterium hibernum]